MAPQWSTTRRATAATTSPPMASAGTASTTPTTRSPRSTSTATTPRRTRRRSTRPFNRRVIGLDFWIFRYVGTTAVRSDRFPPPTHTATRCKYVDCRDISIVFTLNDGAPSLVVLNNCDVKMAPLSGCDRAQFLSHDADLTPESLKYSFSSCKKCHWKY